MAHRTTIEQLTNEFNALDTRIKKIRSQIEQGSTEVEIQEQMAQFLQMAEQEMSQLQRDMEELDGVKRSLAEFFCEDASTFKIEECYKIFHQFCQKFNQAIAENERRRIQEEQVQARRKQREEQLLAKKRLRECNITSHFIFNVNQLFTHSALFVCFHDCSEQPPAGGDAQLRVGQLPDGQLQLAGQVVRP